MTTTKIYCPDIECNSCVRLLEKTLASEEGVHEIKFGKDSLEVSHNPEKITTHAIIKLIHERGFRAGTEPFAQKTMGERWRSFRENKAAYSVEYLMFKYSLWALFLLLAIEAMGYYAFFNDPTLLAKYAAWAIYLAIAIVSIGASLWQLKSYRAAMSGMMGMMVGMTFGMQSGMIIGTIVGATNGMFTGSVTGMLAAILLGFYSGKSAGHDDGAFLQGVMAGLMGGVMGGMTGVMLWPDNIMWFMPIFMVINILIMWGISYLVYEEMVEGNPMTKKQPVDFWVFLAYSVLALAILFIIILYGPKSGFARVI